MPPVGSAAALYDIARVAGVNPSTVSRDLNKPGRVSVKTEERIHAAAKALSYRLNPMALALPTGRTSTLGLLLADITNPMFFELVRGAERIAPSVDGLILVATRLTDEQIRSLAERKRLVVINRRVDGIEEVVPDLEPGIDQALALLWEFGHRSAAFLSGPAEAWMSGGALENSGPTQPCARSRSRMRCWCMSRWPVPAAVCRWTTRRWSPPRPGRCSTCHRSCCG